MELAQNMQILIVMISYMVFIIVLGFYLGRKVKSDTDYAIAGRSLPGWAAALSERATGESSWALLGLPGMAYATGLVETWTALGCVAGVIVTWSLLAWRLQKGAANHEISSFTDYIAKHHSDSEKMVRVIGSLTIVFFFFFYVGAQFLGGGKTLYTLFNIKPEIGMLVIALVVVPYTIYGGFRSVVYTDVIQAVIMIVTLVIGPIAGIFYLMNNPDQAYFAHSIGEALSKAGPEYNSFTGVAQGFTGGVVIVGGFSWFFGYLGGQPQLSMRFMAIKDRKQAIQARNIGIVWTVLAYIGALSIGWLGIAIFGPTGLEDQEFVMPMVITKIFPPIVAGILITGAIAAIISTANSLLIVSATELSENIVKTSFEKRKKAYKGLKSSRIITALLAVIALIFAYYSYSPLTLNDKSIDYLKEKNIPVEVINSVNELKDKEFYKKGDFSEAIAKTIGEQHQKEYGQIIFESAKKEGTLIFTMVSYVWAGIGGTFSIVIILTLFWKKYHGRAVVLTIIVGMLFTIIWISTGMEKILTTRILTFVVAGLTAVIATLTLKKK